MSSLPAHITVNGNAYFFNGVSSDTMAGAALFDSEVEGLGEITHQKPEISFNTDRTYKNGRKAPDGIEIRFGMARPTEATRQVLKDHGYQFSERQKIWYAIDEPISRKLADEWAEATVEVDTTQYEKLHFWAKVTNRKAYVDLRNRTEFMVSGNPPKFFYAKSYLEKAFNTSELITEGQLFFKKFYNKALDVEDPAEPLPPAGEPQSANSNGTAIADKLQALADGMQNQIDSKINSATSRQRPTAKRLRVAAGMRNDGYKLRDIQTVLYGLAAAHRDGTIADYPYLLNIRSKQQVELLNRYAYAVKNSWEPETIQRIFDDAISTFEKLNIKNVYEWSLAEVQKGELLAQKRSSNFVQRQQQENQEKIKQLEQKAFGEDIPGFFPTPPSLIDRMIKLADLDVNHSILDPSAGKGDILDAVSALYPGKNPSLYACEINSTLREILHLKGYTLCRRDFLELEPGHISFDRIVMNPPFENGQDAAHITHALSLLRPGGRLVAIAGEGVFFRSFKRDKAFRELLLQTGAYVSVPIKEAFKNSFNTTGVTVRIIAINQDYTPIRENGHISPSYNTTTNTMEEDTQYDEQEHYLEIEAEAELELLKLRVELERKRKQKPNNGLEGIDPGKLQLFQQRAWALQHDVAVLDFK